MRGLRGAVKDDVLVLDDFGAEVWQLLGQAEAAGVTFIGGELAKSVRLLSEPGASAVISIPR